MEDKNNMDDLLTRYLFDESGPEERSLVINWIKDSRENRAYFEELTKTFDLLAGYDGIEKINVAEEWNHLQEALSAGTSHQMQSYEGIAASASTGSQESNHRWRKIYRLIIPAAVAASVIGLVLFQVFFQGSNDGGLSKPEIDSTAVNGLANAVIHHEKNPSRHVKTFHLPDGSRVDLSGNSELTYSEQAGAHQRNVLLKGEADFTVVKNNARPFTVVSGSISTVAVGTRFTVTAYESEKFIQVKLTEGKVLVKPEKVTTRKQADNFYLLPGQRLIYDKNRKTVKIKSFRGDDKNIARTVTGKNKTINDNPLIPDYNKKSWFMFNNQSLDETFHALEFMYDVKIMYAKEDVEQRYFVGTFSKSDPVENILRKIAILNKLTVTKKDNLYTITKKR